MVMVIVSGQSMKTVVVDCVGITSGELAMIVVGSSDG